MMKAFDKSFLAESAVGYPDFIEYLDEQQGISDYYTVDNTQLTKYFVAFQSEFYKKARLVTFTAEDYLSQVNVYRSLIKMHLKLIGDFIILGIVNYVFGYFTSALSRLGTCSRNLSFQTVALFFVIFKARNLLRGIKGCSVILLFNIYGSNGCTS